jgi:alanine dehydrogenase
MEIGIPKETRRREYRVSLVPADVGKLVEAGHQVHVVETAGLAAGFPAEQYEQAGANIVNSVAACDLVVSVKAPQMAVLKDGVTIMAYLHVEKGQNARLLARLRKKKILSYAFEEIRARSGTRLINLGLEAGIVGAAEGLRILGTLLSKNHQCSTFGQLRPVLKYGSKEGLYSAIAGLGARNGINIVVMGRGLVSRGVQEVLTKANIEPQVLWRKETAEIERYLPDVDMLVNAVDWYPEEPRIVKRTDLALMKKKSLIVDISCDTNGAIESCITTTWANPVYKVDGISHFCVGNLPSAIPRDASIHLSKMILPHVRKVANGKRLATGMMTRGGEFVYRRPEVD